MAVTFLARLRAPVLAGLGIVIVTVGLAPAAQSAPTITGVKTHLAALAKKNEALTEQYNRAGEELKSTRRDAKRAVTAATRALDAYELARDQVKLSIADQYRGDGMGGTSALLTSNSSQNYLDRLAALQLVSAHRTSVATQLRAAQTAADRARVTAEQLRGEAGTKRAALATQRDTVAAQQSKYHTLLDKLTAQQRRAFLAAAAKKARANTPTGSYTDSGDVPAPSKAASIAVEYALAQQGKPYVFAAAGPGAFDCSGLTMAAWARAGVSMPHFAAWQYNVGHHVGRDQLAPGDLVFFYSPIGHVAMYIGHGMIVHAPTEGDVVKVVPLSTFDSDYVGATRP